MMIGWGTQTVKALIIGIDSGFQCESQCLTLEVNETELLQINYKKGQEGHILTVKVKEFRLILVCHKVLTCVRCIAAGLASLLLWIWHCWSHHHSADSFHLAGA